ncbi:MAG: HipA domain-containing protein [Chitinophagaceae bacterium]|nr:HipA domain-containing protein [Chitinophagaceae bacterium]
MSCYGCYKENTEGYCAGCRKKLFGGKRVSHVLAFDAPTAENIPAYQEKTKQLSISGVQLKYSVKLEGKELVLTETKGEYLLKPIPPRALIALQDQAPENEHLTMQIAKQLFAVPVAENALILFKDGTPAYITKRFDVKPDGSKQLQEDFAQISGKTKKNAGDHYKYNGSYEAIGQLIRDKVAASPPVLEVFFKLVLFNYVFSNGDAHLKNFSLVQTEYGDYMLSKAYDLMCTVLHTPTESDTALELYEGDVDSTFYKQHGYYGRPDFEELATRMFMVPKRAQHIIDTILKKQQEVSGMIEHSFLSSEAKERYVGSYTDKIKRFS